MLKIRYNHAMSVLKAWLGAGLMVCLVTLNIAFFFQYDAHTGRNKKSYEDMVLLQKFKQKCINKVAIDVTDHW